MENEFGIGFYLCIFTSNMPKNCTGEEVVFECEGGNINWVKMQFRLLFFFRVTYFVTYGTRLRVHLPSCTVNVYKNCSYFFSTIQ